MGRFDALLHLSSFPQRKTLLNLIVKRNSLDDRKRVGGIELSFNGRPRSFKHSPFC